MKTEQRPKGVKIVATLIIISGILLVLGGLFFILSGSLLEQIAVRDQFRTFDGNVLPRYNDTDIISTNYASIVFASQIMVIMGSIFIAFGILCFIVAWGILEGKPWSWITTIILSIISIIVDVIFISKSIEGAQFVRVGVILVSLIIDGIIIWYLYRPNVKLYFGRIKAQSP